MKKLGDPVCFCVTLPLESSNSPGIIRIESPFFPVTESWVASPLVSNNHFMLGHIWEWFYSGLGGVRQQEGVPPQDGYILAPETVDSLSFVTVKYQSPYGEFRSHWSRENDTLSLAFTIPANAVLETAGASKKR